MSTGCGSELAARSEGEEGEGSRCAQLGEGTMTDMYGSTGSSIILWCLPWEVGCYQALLNANAALGVWVLAGHLFCWWAAHEQQEHAEPLWSLPGFTCTGIVYLPGFAALIICKTHLIPSLVFYFPKSFCEDEDFVTISLYSKPSCFYLPMPNCQPLCEVSRDGCDRETKLWKKNLGFAGASSSYHSNIWNPSASKPSLHLL